MRGNINNRPVGRCSQCGGVVSVPYAWWGVNRPVPTCESCGAVADPYRHLPIIPTKGERKGWKENEDFGEPDIKYECHRDVRRPYSELIFKNDSFVSRFVVPLGDN